MNKKINNKMNKKMKHKIINIKNYQKQNEINILKEYFLKEYFLEIYLFFFKLYSWIFHNNNIQHMHGHIIGCNKENNF